MASLPRPDWLFRIDDENAGVPRNLAAGIRSRVFTGDKIQVCVVRFDPHSAGSIHCHPEEQWGVVLEGECVRIQGGVEYAVKAGDFWHTPGGVVHGVRTGAKPAVLLDVFTPVREQYRAAAPGAASEQVSGPRPG